MLLFLLAMCAGASDGWSFLGFGEVFVANMTGNMVLMGISIFRPHSNLFHTMAILSGQVVHPALALLAYAVGATAMVLGIQPGRLTLPISIWVDYDHGDLAHASLAVAALTAVSLALVMAYNASSASRQE